MKAISNPIAAESQNHTATTTTAPSDAQSLPAEDFFATLIANFMSAKPVASPDEQAPPLPVNADTPSSQENEDNEQVAVDAVLALNAALNIPIAPTTPQANPITTANTLSTEANSVATTTPAQQDLALLTQMKKMLKEDNTQASLEQAIASVNPDKSTEGSSTAATHAAIAAPLATMLNDVIAKQTPINQTGNNANNLQAVEAQDQKKNEQVSTDFTANLVPDKTAPLNTTPIIASPSVNSDMLGVQKNKFTTALVQLGQFVNNHTTQEFAARTPQMDASQTAQMTYSEVLTKAQQENDYGLKVELHPMNLDAQLKEVYSANIKIYPPELGAMLAKLKVGKGGTELLIITQSDDVKRVVEANLGQLRQDFQRADINLTNIQVDVQSGQAGSRDNQQAQKQFSSNVDDMQKFNQAETTTKTQQPSAQKLNSLVDTYA